MAPNQAKKPAEAAGEIMLVNDVPGEECRIAVLQDGRLEHLFTERAATATSVGNIYKGRVSNVESAIQAAFVDYGQQQRGFLHISDLHPRYFPGGEESEKVGKKTAHRDRPPIQKALKRGDEVLVQVLKEGIGTKGPTLTSYLSIPGRLMVMMPYMDRIGVTRRVADEDERKAMRKVLDSLDLPEEFGFILRTAGMGQTKRELKRDVAYLTRMWKVMETRIERTGTPAELYTESDLVLRTVRDVLRPEIKAIIVDSESAFERLQGFLNVIAPRSAPPVIHYRRGMPLFHAFNVERQIETIHAREVDLPSGGRLVIDQTEALVAIDVNSGRSRSARDSETNAYQTNMEAIDEIARQLRLRDLGGLVINDLIDMRQRSKRKEVYEKFRELLKVDRARTTVLPISDFGILEMTRQRMRPSIRMANYVECQQCSGHGEVKAPDLVASDAVREIGYLLHCDETARVEIVVSPRVASSLLSTKRRTLDLIEDRMGKPVDVRVSESIPVDRVTFYAYDERGNDLDLSKLTPANVPTVETLIEEADSPEPEETKEDGGRRRRRRRRNVPPADAAAIALSGEFQRELAQLDAEEEAAEQAAESSAGQAKRRRRRRRRRRPEPVISAPERLYVLAKAMGVSSKDILSRWRDSGGAQNTGFELKSHQTTVTPEQASMIQGWFESSTAAPDQAVPDTENKEDVPSKGKRRRRRRRDSAEAHSKQTADPVVVEANEADSAPLKKKRIRKKAEAKAAASKKKTRKKSTAKTSQAEKTTQEKNDTSGVEAAVAEPRRRTLYRGRRKLAPGEADAAIAEMGPP